MPSTVHKAIINLEDISDRVEIECPTGSEILSAALQYPGQVAIWYRCNPNRLKRRRTIHLVGTGHRAPTLARFVSTIVMMNGDFVLHVFDQGE